MPTSSGRLSSRRGGSLGGGRERTFGWNECTFGWNECTFGWNECTLARNECTLARTESRDTPEFATRPGDT